jgi:glycerol-3-phosphate acyltransferase PlsY
MSAWSVLVFACLAAYLLGSVSFAVLSSRLFGLADPRTYGSGNPGATNVLRSGSRKAAFVTLLGDAGKGVVAVVVAQTLPPAWPLPDGGVGWVAVAVFLGHLYPVFLRFRGGKGVATAAGALVALSPWVGLATVATWLVTARLSRYSSLAAFVAAILAPFWLLLIEEDGPLLAVMVIAALLIFRHRGNIARLVQGKEGKIGATVKR